MEHVERTHRFVIQTLGPKFPEMIVAPDGEIAIRNGSATLYVSTKQGFGPTGTLLSMHSPLVHRLPMSPELLRWSATDGRAYDLGGVYVVPSGDPGSCEVWLGHSFVGDEVDPGALLSTAYQLLVLADHLDDVIRDRFGGVRYHDRST